MANSFVLTDQFLPLLDEAYQYGSLTSMLDAANSAVRFNGGNKVEIYKLDMDGLGNYSRATGFPSGDVTGTWEQKVLTQDRGRSFSIDAMDDEETLSLTVANTLGTFLRTKVVPEIDAYRFATYANAAGTKATSTSDVLADIDKGLEVMTDAEVDMAGNILFISAAKYNALKNKINRTLGNENVVAHAIGTLEEMPVVVVPTGRFKTAITIGANGFTPASGAKDIDFMIVNPAAVIQTVKHEVPRVFDPATNQAADAWKIDYRIYHDAFPMDKKVNGIYLANA